MYTNATVLLRLGNSPLCCLGINRYGSHNRGLDIHYPGKVDWDLIVTNAVKILVVLETLLTYSALYYIENRELIDIVHLPIYVILNLDNVDLGGMAAYWED